MRIIGLVIVIAAIWIAIFGGAPTWKFSLVMLMLGLALALKVY